MQTFLPYSDFTQSVESLDYRRLGKQRLENYQILKALKGYYHETGAWENHPVTKMWEGYELALLNYQEHTIQEWTQNRGYKDTCWQKSLDLFTEEELLRYETGFYEKPPWLGNENVHKAHQSNLIRKDPEFYQPVFGYSIPADLPYIYKPVELSA